ncbi:782_t:CDS:2, partial [Funneliformis geosporum]
MPNILTNSKIQPKEKNSSFERSNFLSKGDLITTFSYGVVAIFVAQKITITENPMWTGALTGFYEESLKTTVESKTQEFKNLLERNIAYGQQTQQAL